MGDRPVRPEVSRVAKWSTRLEGPPGISLAEEFARLKIFSRVDSEALELLGQNPVTVPCKIQRSFRYGF